MREVVVLRDISQTVRGMRWSASTHDDKLTSPNIPYVVWIREAAERRPCFSSFAVSQIPKKKNFFLLIFCQRLNTWRRCGFKNFIMQGWPSRLTRGLCSTSGLTCAETENRLMHKSWNLYAHFTKPWLMNARHSKHKISYQCPQWKSHFFQKKILWGLVALIYSGEDRKLACCNEDIGTRWIQIYTHSFSPPLTRSELCKQYNSALTQRNFVSRLYDSAVSHSITMINSGSHAH